MPHLFEVEADFLEDGMLVIAAVPNASLSLMEDEKFSYGVCRHECTRRIEACLRVSNLNIPLYGSEAVKLHVAFICNLLREEITIQLLFAIEIRCGKINQVPLLVLDLK